MPITKGSRALVDEAMAKVKTYSVEQILRRMSDPTLQIVDIRDVRELEREGTIVGCFNAPRGMLEFWVDPESPYHKPVFASGKRFIFYCQSDWRSSLATATVQAMGLEPTEYDYTVFRITNDTLYAFDVSWDPNAPTSIVGPDRSSRIVPSRTYLP